MISELEFREVIAAALYASAKMHREIYLDIEDPKLIEIANMQAREAKDVLDGRHSPTLECVRVQYKKIKGEENILLN